ncbi:MAG TPA: DNA-directed RNA polymerase subunit omega [Bacteroidota bacterium]
MSVRPIELTLLEGKAENIYEAIAVMSKRARQVNEKLKVEFNERLDQISVNPESTEEETDTNPDQVKISVEFEKRPKPTAIAVEDMVKGKVQHRYKEPEVVPPTEE